jgi:3-oxoacyl-[acyl-carrier protein] reductase
VINTRLRNTVVLITGVNNPFGVGAATAKAFAAEGAKIFGTYLALPAKATATDSPGLEFYESQISKPPDEVVASIRKLGGAIEVVAADLANPELVPLLFDQAEKAFGPVDVLVNNAAYDAPDTFVPQSHLARANKTLWDFPIAAITADSHDRHFSINSRAVALMMAEYARRFVGRGADWGRIINVSTDGASGFGAEVSYGASKHALESYSRAAAKELGKYGITVNVVSLGAIQTGWITPDLEKRISAETPLGGIGRPEDVADVILFLASEQARWLTGQMLYVGGGHQMPL